jgi:tRNA(Ile)-lysidine synthase
LLHALNLSADKLAAPLRAVHVHHGLLPDADRWTEHCRTTTKRLAVPCDILSVNAAPRPGESPESRARQARYGALAAHLPDRAMLLTAHHRDDQAETVLLQLLRGAGPAGLAAMAALAKRDFGWLGRPLLDIEQIDVRAYAERHALVWVDDPSNADTRLDRNYLRLEVMPLLRARWPGLGVALARSAGHCAAAERLTAARGARLLATATSSDRYQLPLAYLLQQTVDDQALLLRHWLVAGGLPLPDANRLRRLVSEVALAGANAMPMVRWPGAEVRRWRGALYAMPTLPEIPDAAQIAWPTGRALALPGGLGELVLGESGLALDAGVIESGKLSVRFRGEGVAATPAGRKGRRSFKRLCQDWGIPPWLRQRIPLFYVDDRLVAIGDLLACEPFGASAAGQVVRLLWNRPPYLGQQTHVVKG